MENNDAAPNPLFTLRSVGERDMPFVYHSFLKSFRDSPDTVGIPNDLFYEQQHDVVESLVRSPLARAVVACAPDDPDQIYGYIIGRDCGQYRVLDWVYVKHPFRNYGIARALVTDLLGAYGGDVFYSHRVKHMAQLLKGRPWKYNFFTLMRLAV